MIYVCPLSAVETCAADLKPSHVVSLLDPESMATLATPQGIAPDRHMRLAINDISTPIDGHIHPEETHVAELIAFLRGWTGEAPLLIHCWAGISRSTATAFIAMCIHDEEACEFALARLLREKGVHAQPNRLIVALADEILGREGRMVEAVEAMGAAQPAFEGVLFELPHPPQVARRAA